MTSALRPLQARIRRLSGPLGRRSLVEAVGVVVICALIVLGLARAGLFSRADAAVHDAFMTAAAASPPDERIVLVAIDNRSLEALGRWPWPRTLHARLIDRLTDAGVAAAAIDVLFIEPTPDDQTLAAALARSGRVCLPLAVEPDGRDGAPWSEQSPTPVIANASAGLGQVNLAPDPDGVVRRLPVALDAPGRTWPHLMSCLLEVAGISPALQTASLTPDTTRAAGGLRATPAGLRFPARQGAFRSVSFVDVLNDEVPAELLSGKLVLIGMTADGQGDRYATPTAHGVLTPGVEIQAVLLDALLSGKAIRPAPSWIMGVIGGGGLIILMLAFLMLRPRWGLAAAACLIVVVFAASAILFVNGFWAPPLAPVAALALACPLWSWRRLAVTSAYLDGELRRFVDETGTATGSTSPFDGEDVVSRQTHALQEAVERLRGRNRFIADTLESLPDAAVVADGDDAILYANQKARDLFADERLENTSLTAGLNRLAPELADALTNGGEARLGDGRVLRLDAAPLADGLATRRIVRLADVTTLRAAERQREEALQLLGHDMRAPQTAILALIEGGVSAPLDRIADYARTTLMLADDYVRLARAEAGPLTIERLGLSDLAVEAADILWPVAQKGGVRVIVEEAPEIEIDADRGLVTRALMNLIDNAVKHSPSGGEIHVTFDVVGDRAQAAVRDAGDGLSQDDFDRLVRPFQHGADGRAGAGLGLAFVDKAARRHGGDLTLAQAAPGAIFVLSLPLASPD